MIKKSWDLYLPFVLFIYRYTPHTVAGFAPFQLIYGHNVRDPLEVIRDGWINGDVVDSNLVDWVNQLKLIRLISQLLQVTVQPSLNLK